jgi:aminoglycoside phosphotransferase (APT) family kinase protein
MLPDPVRALLAPIFPDAAITDVAPTFGGFSNLTLTATIGGRRCAVKAASHPAKRADVRRESLVLHRLSGGSLPAPVPLGLTEDETWTVSVTGHIPGEPGLRLYELSSAELARPYHELGRVLAQVHAFTSTDVRPAFARTVRGRSANAREWTRIRRIVHPYSRRLAQFADRKQRRRSAGVRDDLDLATRANATRVALAGLGLEDDLRAALDGALAHPAWRSNQKRLVHGDAGLHNILWDDGVTALLDWEWAGWGNPALDLAWVGWTMRFRQVPNGLWHTLLEGYGPSHTALDLGDETLHALALGQVASILVRSHGRPGAWEEWVKRARWSATE